MELLCPVASFNSLEAAVQNGADAVYFGGPVFNARRFAEGIGDVKAAVTYAHTRGCKAYFTLNTLLLDKEFSAWAEFAVQVARQGIDAFIVQDLGGAAVLQHTLPDVPLHASTQMTIHHSDAIPALQQQGFSRFILARELTAPQIAHIKQSTGAEIEVFAHGALCYSYSGQCLMSSMLGGRSANRGVCAQPCRLPYTLDDRHGYLLSTKDLCLLGHMDMLHKASVDCIKLEGRMKRPEYVAAVTRAYRKAIDGDAIDDDTREMIALVFNRGGFTAGMFAEEPHRLYAERPDHIGMFAGRVVEARHNSITVQSHLSFDPGDDIALSQPDSQPVKILQVHQADQLQILTLNNAAAFHFGTEFQLVMRTRLTQELHRAIGSNRRKQPVFAKVTIQADEPMTLHIKTFYGTNICVQGDVPQPARTHPLTYEAVARQLSKTAEYPFYFVDIEADIGDNLSLPVRSLNALRRQGLEAVVASIADFYADRQALPYTPAQKAPPRVIGHKQLAAQVYTQAQALAVRDFVDILYVPVDMETPDAFSDGNARLCAWMPLITTDEALERLRPLTEQFDHVMAGSFIQSDRIEIADYGFNITNSETLVLLCRLGFTRATLSPELNTAQIRGLSVPDGLQTEVIAYGRHTLMTTAHCPFDCGGGECRIRPGSTFLRDRKNMRFPLVRAGKNGLVSILNSVPVYMADRIDELCADVLRLAFTIEPPEECAHIAQQYRKALDDPAYRPPFDGEYTRGHFNRGLGGEA